MIDYIRETIKNMWSLLWKLQRAEKYHLSVKKRRRIQGMLDPDLSMHDIVLHVCIENEQNSAMCGMVDTRPTKNIVEKQSIAQEIKRSHRKTNSTNSLSRLVHRDLSNLKPATIISNGAPVGGKIIHNKLQEVWLRTLQKRYRDFF